MAVIRCPRQSEDFLWLPKVHTFYHTSLGIHKVSPLFSSQLQKEMMDGGGKVAFVAHALPASRRATSIATPRCSTEPCAGCGREEGVARGCDGDGRVIGGLGAVVKWWPIKAYRPCEYLVNARIRYERKGQSLDEIAFGRKSRGDDKSLQQRLRGD